jgi:deazaflavin-dependent oxidoreductase (nitroreductase family)
LVASTGGAPKHPVWYFNLKENTSVKIQDGPNIYDMKVREIIDPAEKIRLWDIAVDAFPPYQEYQERTDRVIPVFLAEPVS